jgi:hypothetical protein
MDNERFYVLCEQDIAASPEDKFRRRPPFRITQNGYQFVDRLHIYEIPGIGIEPECIEMTK